MLEDLQPLGLKEAAVQLGVDPFEVVRLLVVTDAVPTHFRFTQEQVDRLRDAAGLQNWWQGGAGAVPDANPKRGRVRAVIKQLLDRRIVSPKSTRLDNVWRGLPDEERHLLEQAVGLLVQEGHLATSAAPLGVQIAVNPASVGALEGIVSSGNGSASLNALWG